MKNLSVLFGVLVFAVSGCRCGEQPQENDPDVVPVPAAVTFEACPNADEQGAPITEGVFPHIKKILLRNDGRVPTGELKFSFEGPGAANYEVIDPPESIDRLSEVELTIRFSPSAKGTQAATLVIDDGDEDTDDVRVDLEGSGKDLPSRPQLEFDIPLLDGGSVTCNVESVLFTDCELEFPPTQVGESVTLELTVRNLGCPALNLKALNVDETGTVPGSFAVTEPAVLPTDDAPLSLNFADNTRETKLHVTFTAIDDVDDPGNNFQSRFATLPIGSNDPGSPESPEFHHNLSLKAVATKPSIYAQPTSCNFTLRNANDEPADACGNPGAGGMPRGVDDPAKFRLVNEGGQPLTINSVKFRSTGDSVNGISNRFKIENDLVGQTLAPSAEAVLTVSQVNDVLLVLDRIDIVTDVGGSVTVVVVSGIKPRLVTDPSSVIDFGNQEEAEGTRPLVIRNLAGGGKLILESLAISNTTFYSLVDPPAAGTILEPGTEVTTTVKYTRPPSGGTQLAVLNIKSNDTDYGTDGKAIILQAAAPTDTLPTSVLTGCLPDEAATDPDCVNGATGSLTVTAAALVSSRVLTVSGVNAYDDNGIAEYRFSLLATGSTGVQPGATLAHRDEWRKVSDDPDAFKTTFTIDPNTAGSWRVRLQVKDTRDQVSPGTTTLNINVFQ